METNLAAKYTDEHYLSKRELRKALNMSSVDFAWNDIVAYRRQFSEGFGKFKTIGGHPFHLTATPKISEKIDKCQELIERLVASFKGRSEPEKAILRKIYGYSALDAVRKYEGSPVSDSALKAMLNNRYEEGDPHGVPIFRYLSACDAYAYFGLDSSDGDSALANAYSRMLGTTELTSYYRTKDPVKQQVMAGIDDVYAFAPHGSIESLMDCFFEGMKEDGIAPLTKAIASAYFLDSVLPFERYSGEAGALLGLSYFENAGLGKAVYYLPLMAVLEKTKTYVEAGNEAQKTGDITYIVLHAVSILEGLIRLLLTEGEEQLTRVATPYRYVRPADSSQVVRTFINEPEYQRPAPQPAPQPAQQPVQQAVAPQPVPQPAPQPAYQPMPEPAPQPAPAPEPVPQPIPEPEPEPIPEPEPVFHYEPDAGYAPYQGPIEEEPAPIPEPEPERHPEYRPNPAPIPEPVQEPEPIPEPIPEPQPEPVIAPAPAVSIPADEIKPVVQRTAAKKGPKPQSAPSLDPDEFKRAALPKGYKRDPSGLSEKEEKEYARYLLETNPLLTKGQARFYASHCTMGRYYVIQDYKRHARCAYETARTSMDKLAELGYYSKLQVKNKFVYTPKPRGGGDN